MVLVVNEYIDDVEDRLVMRNKLVGDVLEPLLSTLATMTSD